MKLSKVDISGFKRFKNISARIDNNLVALVGPNEAGKTSFLKALVTLEDDEPYSPLELTKKLEISEEDIIIKATYYIDDKEREKLKEFNGLGHPRFYLLYKFKSGKRVHEILETKKTDTIKREKSKREKSILQINKLLENKRTSKFIEDTVIKTYDEIEEVHIEVELNSIFTELLEFLDPMNENLSDETFTIIKQIKYFFQNDVEISNQYVKSKFDLFLEDLILTESIEKETHPRIKFINYLNEKRSKFVFFKNDDRILKTSYNLEDLASPSSSLKNLIRIGDARIEDILTAINETNDGERLELNQNINLRLREVYSNSWSQADVYPQIIIDKDGIRLQIKSVLGYNEITDRSDGLKQYISLRAFIQSKDLTNKPILLIDEAELHLHYAAQSDLIKEFEKQELTNSIIYSTHSAGCLPSDIGNGIRAIEPLIERDINTGYSSFRNSIWKPEGGFSPILFAMGANVIAFTIARKAIIAEGPSETILLPIIFREVAELQYLDFQVAPGIASVSQDNIKLFELEAGRISYLVDGDTGGTKNKNKLLRAGIQEDIILQLDPGETIEDLISHEIIISAVNMELKKSGIEFRIPSSVELPSKNMIKKLEKICEENQALLPNKVTIAENISLISSEKKIVSANQVTQVKKIFKSIQKILEN